MAKSMREQSDEILNAADLPQPPWPEGPPSASALGESFALLQLIWELDHALQTSSRRMKAALGVTGPQRLVVRLVGRHPGIAAGQLARLLHLDPSTLTGILDRLVELGSLERRIDSRDRRRALFSLTPRGRRIEEVELGTVEAAAHAALAKISQSDLQGFRSVVAAMTGELNARSG